MSMVSMIFAVAASFLWILTVFYSAGYMRGLKEHLRGAGVVTGGPPTLGSKDRARFSSKLDELVQKSLREFPPEASG